MIYKFTSANFLYPIGCLLKTRILNIRIFNLVFYTIWTLGLTLLNWIFFSNLDPLWGVHLYMSFPVGRFQYIRTVRWHLYQIFWKKEIYLTPGGVWCLDSHLVFLFPSTSQCPLYFLFDTNFYLTKYLYRRLEVKIYANVECVNKLFKAGDEFCLHSF